MKFSPGRFNGLIANIAQQVAWWKTDRCPCRDPYSGGPTQGCPSCGGRGWLWNAQTAGTLFLSGMKVQSQWATFGLYQTGDVSVTLPSNSSVYALKDMDRVRFTDSSAGVNQTFTHGVDDTVLPFQLTSIDRVFVLNGSQLPQDLTTPTIHSDQTLTWASGQEPAAGQQYTLTGRARPEYFVAYSSVEQDRAHHRGFALPRRIILRRFDLFGR